MNLYISYKNILCQQPQTCYTSSMKSKIPFIIIIVILIAVIGFLAFSKTAKKEPSVPVDQNPPIQTTGGAVSPTMVSVDEDSFLLGISGSYPQFTQASDVFNKKIADIITTDISGFKTQVDLDYQARLKIGGEEFKKQFENGDLYNYQVKTDIIQSNANYISAVVHYGGDGTGAHGYENIATFNYDVKKQKELTLTDFITLTEASAASRIQLTRDIGLDNNPDKDIVAMLQDGTNPILENFKSFTFTDRNITIYFAAYQVGPYALGKPTVTIPR